MISLAGISMASAEDDKISPAVLAPDNSQCNLKTELSADMVAKCTEAMAKGDKAMLEGCCQKDDEPKS